MDFILLVSFSLHKHKITEEICRPGNFTGWMLRVWCEKEGKFFLLLLQLHWLWGQPSLYLNIKGSCHTTKSVTAFGAKIKYVLSSQYLHPSKYLHGAGQDNLMFMYSLWSIIMLYSYGLYCHIDMQGGQHLVIADKVSFLGMFTYLCRANCNLCLLFCTNVNI
jgi:hypothetical protein